jgi:hypothetical protein
MALKLTSDPGSSKAACISPTAWLDDWSKQPLTCRDASSAERWDRVRSQSGQVATGAESLSRMESSCFRNVDLINEEGRSIALRDFFFARFASSLLLLPCKENVLDKKPCDVGVVGSGLDCVDSRTEVSIASNVTLGCAPDLACWDFLSRAPSDGEADSGSCRGHAGI